MIPRVVPYLEAVAVQFRDLFPRQVLLLVRRERESFGNEERRAETVLLQQRTDDRVVARLRVVERQDDLRTVVTSRQLVQGVPQGKDALPSEHVELRREPGRRHIALVGRPPADPVVDEDAHPPTDPTARALSENALQPLPHSSPPIASRPMLANTCTPLRKVRRSQSLPVGGPHSCA